MSEKIIYHPIDMVEQKPLKDRNNCYIEIDEKYMKFCCRFWASEPIIKNDPKSGWHEVFNYWDITASRINITGFEKSITAYNRWCLLIGVMGFTQDIKLYFLKEKELDNIYKKLMAWKYGDSGTIA